MLVGDRDPGQGDVVEEEGVHDQQRLLLGHADLDDLPGAAEGEDRPEARQREGEELGHEEQEGDGARGQTHREHRVADHADALG